MGQCLTPFGIRHKMTNETIPVPCGRCPECMKRRVSGWSFRLMQEEKVSTSAYFITLTYDQPIMTRNGFMTLDKPDVQKFMKRLRKAVSQKYPHIKVKYYLCGEYGTKGMRPHYHAIIFNVPDTSFIEAAWNKGYIHYGTVSGASVGYTLKYMDKPKKIPFHRNDDRTPEFALMSKGLGENFLSNAAVRYHHADKDNRYCITIEGGKKIAMPRYYKNKIFTDQERKQIGFFSVIKNRALEERARLLNPNYDRDKHYQAVEMFRKQLYSCQNRQTL